MMQLKSAVDVILSRFIQEITPLSYDSIKIKNRLLDGTFHTQTIGEPQPFVDVEIYVNEIQLDAINSAQAHGEQLILISEENEYVGYIDEPIQWIRKTPKVNKTSVLYFGTFKFLINGVGEL